MGATLLFFLTSAISIGFGVVFFGAIQTLLHGVGAIVATTLLGDLIEVISMCLPFDGLSFFGGLIVLFNAIITFLISRKIFYMLLNLLGASKS